MNKFFGWLQGACINRRFILKWPSHSLWAHGFCPVWHDATLKARFRKSMMQV